MNFFSACLISIIFIPQISIALVEVPRDQTLSRDEHSKIIQVLKLPSVSTDRVKLITDEATEVPDPTRPLLLEFPTGEKRYVIGFSGQSIMIIDSLKDLVTGGIKPIRKVELLNKFGYQYGGEIDPATGIPWGYSADSSTWDVSIFRYKKENGDTGLKVLAGAMGTGEDGKPFLSKDHYNYTRQRLFFDAEFRGYDLHAYDPMAVLNTGKPVDGNWIQKNEKGEIIFSHGYGGEPVTLDNGDLFIDERGWVPFVYETVVEQREEVDPNHPGRIIKIPYRTAIVITYLDKSLTKIMKAPKIIFDVFKKDGTVWSATQRPTAGPLVEGAHIEVRYRGKKVESMSEVRALTKSGKNLEYQMLFSAGEYFGLYGSYMAYSFGNLESFQPVTNDQGELLDLTEPLRVLFTWIGRPVSFHVDGKEYLLIHGVDRNSLPPGMLLDQLPRSKDFPYYKRQEIVVPVERVMEKGLPRLKIKDESGLIEYLKKFKPRKISQFKFILKHQIVALKIEKPKFSHSFPTRQYSESHLG